MVFASRRRCYRCHAPCAAAGGAAAGPTARDLNDRGRGRAKFGLWCGRLLAALGPAPGGGAAAVEAWLEDVPVQTKHFQTIVLDEKTILINNVRYIKSWKGTKKTPKTRTKQNRAPYMREYRLKKRDEVAHNIALFDKMRRQMLLHNVPLPS